MVRSRLVTALCIALASLSASPQKAAAEDQAAKLPDTFLMIQEENAVVRRTIDPSVTLVLMKPFTRHFGIFANSITSKMYGVAYAGPAYIINEHLVLGIGAGIEQAWLVDPDAKTSARGGLIASANYDHFNAFGIVETGGSGPWYRLYATLRPESWIGFGVFVDAVYGFGIYGDIVIPKTPIQLYGAAPTDTETGETVGIFGARLYL